MAADQGNPDAQFDLAELYMTGTGVPRDFDEASTLFTLASKTLDVSKQLKELSSKRGESESAKSQLERAGP
jgi:TPR repeat protein